MIGTFDARGKCLIVLVAHADSVPPGLGANDNASGVGALIGLAPRLAVLDPPCDVWLAAGGAEERVVIGTGYHVGAAALVRTIRRRGRARDLRLALSVDMVGRGKRFYLRSPGQHVRRGVEGRVLGAARRAGVTVRWVRDSGLGNSDHRELEQAGLPAAVLEVWRGRDRCHHERCDRAGRLQKARCGGFSASSRSWLTVPRSIFVGHLSHASRPRSHVSLEDAGAEREAARRRAQLPTEAAG